MNFKIKSNNVMNYQRLFLSGIFLSLFMLSASAKTFIIGNDSTTVRTSDTDYADELEKIRMHMPDIEVGNGISFQPKNKSYKLTMRIRMQIWSISTSTRNSRLRISTPASNGSGYVSMDISIHPNSPI